MKILRALVLSAVMLCTGFALGSCAGRPDLADAEGQAPELEVERFLNGRLEAHGVFIDILGTVRRQFVVQVNGVWDGEVLTLTEDFVYEDGTTEQRVWTLRKTGEETWEGTAPGVVGTAEGEERGNAFTWRYTIDLATPDGTQRFSLEDWLWQIDDRVMINKAYVSKFGVTVGELIITFRREEPLPPA